MDKLDPDITFFLKGIQNGAVKNEHWNHILFLLEGIKKGGIIICSQVSSKPADCDFLHFLQLIGYLLSINNGVGQTDPKSIKGLNN
jgi:hypothetical protein